MVELAVEGNAGIDLHLHDPDQLGTFTMKRLAQLTKEAGLQGKVAISHAFGLEMFHALRQKKWQTSYVMQALPL